MNDILISPGKAIGGSLVGVYILRARVVFHDGTVLFAMLNKPIIGGITVFFCYLTVVNIIAVVIFMGLLLYSSRRWEETRERQGLYFWFFELFCLIGGAVGILISMIITNQKLGKHTATMYVYALAMIEAWSVLIMIIVNPFRQTLAVVQNVDPSSHLGFILYFAVINIVLLLIILIDRNNRHRNWSRIETVEVVLGLMGGTFLVSVVTWFYGVRGNGVFGWGFSILCATHTFAIGYLLCAGLI